ncbi:transposase [Paenibacillus tarimensis]
MSKWAFAIHTVTRSEGGINAVQLQSYISVTYKTAWAMLKKIRHAISSHDQTRPLSGLIKGGLAFCGKYAPSTIQLTVQEHPVIIATASQSEEQPEIVKIKLVSRSSMDGKTLTPSSLKAFMQDHVTCTEKINNVTIAAYKIRPRNYSNLVNLMNQFRSWVNDTFHGLGTKHLQNYLDEFCFRFNHASKSPGLSKRLTRICMSFGAG